MLSLVKCWSVSSPHHTTGFTSQQIQVVFCGPGDNIPETTLKNGSTRNTRTANWPKIPRRNLVNITRVLTHGSAGANFTLKVE